MNAKKHTILIVDDEVNICEKIRLYVEKEGYQAIIANDGGEAIEKFKSGDPDLILLDVMLPVKDGWQVCREIRGMSDVPIIMLTAKGESTYEIYLDGKKIEMPPKEFELLYFLAKNTNKVFTRDQLLDEIWGYEFFGDSRTVDVHIKRIREKIESENKNWQLKTVWGVGYKFEAAEQ